jgi:arginase
VEESSVEIAIIGAPVDLGADRRGVDMGPSAIRYAGLEDALGRLGYAVTDTGNVASPVAEATDTGATNLKYLEPIVRMCETLADVVSDAIDAGQFPLVLGGDHSLSLGSVAGVARRRSIGIVWIDAHGDFNTDRTSPSGNIHGMVLAALAGYGDSRLTGIGGISPKVRAENIALVGIRDIDPGERQLLLEAGVHAFTMHEIDREGLPAVMEDAIARASDGVDSLHVSLDLDAVDPRQAPGVGTPVFGGLSYRETHLALEMLASTGSLGSMDVVEVNPILDDHNETARLAVEFTLSALGKRIM